MRLLNLLKRVNLVDFDLELARLEQVEQLIDIEFEFFTGLDVAEKLRTGNFDILGGEFTVQVSAKHSSNANDPTYFKGRGGTGPLAFPNQTMVPFLLTASRLPSQVSFPTES
jgi:hypothetical protein